MILGTLAAVILSGCADANAPPDASADRGFGAQASQTVTIAGLSDVTFDANGHLRRHLAIGSLKWQKQRHGYFSLPFRELGIDQVSLRVSLGADAARPGARDAIELDQVFSTLQDYGAGFAGVTQGKVNALRVEIVVDDTVRFTLQAARARLRADKKRIEFSGGFSVIAADAQQLHANRAEWRVGSDRILATGPVLLVDAEGNASEGGDLAFSLEASGRVRLIGSPELQIGSAVEPEFRVRRRAGRSRQARILRATAGSSMAETTLGPDPPPVPI